MEKEKQLLLEIKHLYNKLVNAPYGSFIPGYDTQNPSGDEYQSDACQLRDKVIELNKECHPAYIDEHTIFNLSHTLSKEVEYVAAKYRDATKPHAAKIRWRELDDLIEQPDKFIWIYMGYFLALKKLRQNKAGMTNV